MKVLLLADHKSIHTQKWAISLTKAGMKVDVFSLNSGYVQSLKEIGVNVYEFNKYGLDTRELGSWKKLRYLTCLSKLKKIIKANQYDILHAHYATSYGILGALSRFSPFILSVWGSDVYEFPEKSYLHKKLLQFNLKRADKILSTSNVMAERTNIFTNKEIIVTPFGIDLKKFFPTLEKTRKKIVIGTVKTLEKKYGINYLIDAFALVKEENPNIQLELHLIGEGSQYELLKKQVVHLGIKSSVKFLGFIQHDMVPKILNTLDIYVALSIYDSESFGVAIVEASACSIPVVVSDVGGLPEVVANNKTGFVVPAKNGEAAAKKINQLVRNIALRQKMGVNGRKRVRTLYDWEKNVQQMINIYKSTQ